MKVKFNKNKEKKSCKQKKNNNKKITEIIIYLYGII